MRQTTTTTTTKANDITRYLDSRLQNCLKRHYHPFPDYNLNVMTGPNGELYLNHYFRLSNGKLFFPYPGSVTKYIHCDIWGHPWERVCQSGMEWDQSLVTCVRISTYDPCVHHNPGDPWLYPHQCDPHKYIHCDTNHQSFVQSCQFDYVFLKDSQTCVPIGSYPGTSNLVNTCHGNNNIGTTRFIQATTRVPGPTSSSVIGYVYNNKDLHVAPCTYANIQANNLYFPVYGNNHQYIQCDLFGRQWLRDCKGSGRNYYDPYSHTCVDGPVFVDNQLG